LIRQQLCELYAASPGFLDNVSAGRHFYPRRDTVPGRVLRARSTTSQEADRMAKGKVKWFN